MTALSYHSKFKKVMEITYRTFWMTPSFGQYAEYQVRTFKDQSEAIKQSQMWDKMITKKRTLVTLVSLGIT